MAFDQKFFPVKLIYLISRVLFGLDFLKIFWHTMLGLSYSLQFQKWPKINFWTRKKFKPAKNAISRKKIAFILLGCTLWPESDPPCIYTWEDACGRKVITLGNSSSLDEWAWHWNIFSLASSSQRPTTYTQKVSNYSVNLLYYLLQ